MGSGLLEVTKGSCAAFSLGAAHHLNHQKQGISMNGRMLKSGLAALALAATLGGSLMAHDDDDRDRARDRFAVRLTWRASRKCRRFRRSRGAASGRGSTPRRTRLPTSSPTTGSKATVQQSHVHFGQKSVNGGVSFFLCTQPGKRPGRYASLPGRPAEITGVITPDTVIGPAGQGIEPAPLRKSWPPSGTEPPTQTSTPTKWPGGEIRGQLH